MADGSASAAHTPVETDVCDVVRLWPPADPAAFKDGLARLASGVAVAACWADGQPRGLLVNSLTGLSTEPPRVLFCVRKAASSHDALLKAEAISLSILAEGQAAEAERFSRSDLAAGRFDSSWRLNPLQPPALAEALVSLSGPVHCRIDAGTHTVFVLDVSEAQSRQAAPLVYFERGFSALAGD
jgi:flavin reductase